MTKEKMYQAIIIFIVFLMAVSAIGYLFFRSAMLSVAGITCNPQTDLLVPALAATLVTLMPGAWNARKKAAMSLF